MSQRFACSGGSLFQQSNFFFHLLAGFESHDKLFRDIDLVTRTRVPSLSRGTLFDFKHTEVSEFDSTIFNQCLDNRIERLLDDLFCLELSQANLFGNCFDDFFFGHVWIPRYQ